MSVLVSGGTQPLGRALIERLLAADRGPVLVTGIEAPETVELPAAVTYIQVDLTRPRRVRQLLQGPCREYGVQSIVHLAFHRRPLKGQRVHRLNVGAARLMLRLAEEHPTIERFVLRSFAAVYATRMTTPDVLREDQPPNLDPKAPQWLRDRVEADLVTCARIGLSRLNVQVLRCAELLAADSGSQLHDYLQSRLCLRPMGFDPMLNVLSLADASRAFELALSCPEQGVFNIPGYDTLPLSRAIHLWGRTDVPVPGPLIGPLYAVRRAVRKTSFRYDLNRLRFHFSSSLDGTRARKVLGYVPAVPISWPRRP